MYRYFLAFRYLMRRPIMWVSIAGVALGIGSIVVVDAIFNGFIEEQQRILRGSNADIVVVPPKLQTPEGLLVIDYDRFRRVIENTEGVAGVSRRLIVPCLFPTEKTLPTVLGLGQISRGPLLQVQGIVAKEELAVSDLGDFLRNAPSERAVPNPEDPFALEQDGIPILFGDRLAEVLEISRGDRMELLTFPSDPEMGEDLEPVSREFVLAGTFRTAELSVDLTTAYLDLEDLQSFARMPADAHEITVRREAGVEEEVLARRLAQNLYPLGVDPGNVRTWRDLGRNWIGAVENQRRILDVILLFVVVVSGFTLLITLNMTISQKIRDIGTLTALGASSGGIASIFTSCGLFVSALGSVTGLLFGTLVALRVNLVHEFLTSLSGVPVFREEVYGFREIPIAFDPTRILWFVLGGCVVTLLFAMVASIRAARLDPIVALQRR